MTVLHRSADVVTAIVAGSIACRTPQCTGPGLALLAPAGDRERSATNFR